MSTNQTEYKMLDRIYPVPDVLPFMEENIMIQEKIFSEFNQEISRNLEGKTIDRVGCVPYVVVNGHIQLLLGKSIQGNISDFGGGRKQSEDVTQCIIREIHEEFGSEHLANLVNMVLIEHPNKCIVMDKYSKLQWRHYPRYISFRSIMLLVPVPYISDMDKYFVKNEEMEDVGWIELRQFYDTKWLSHLAPALEPFLQQILLVNKMKTQTSILNVCLLKSNYYQIYASLECFLDLKPVEHPLEHPLEEVEPPIIRPNWGLERNVVDFKSICLEERQSFGSHRTEQQSILSPEVSAKKKMGVFRMRNIL